MTYTACVENYYLYKRYKEYDNSRDRRIKDEIETLTRENPSVIISCKIWEKILFGRNVLLSEKQETFEYSHCVDVTDLTVIDSKIEAKDPLLVKIKVEFGDPESEKRYKEHVQQFSTQVLKNSGNNVEMTTDILYKVSTVTNERKIDYYRDISYYQRFHWLLKISVWIYEHLWYKFHVITIKKIISTKCEEIL